MDMMSMFGFVIVLFLFYMLFTLWSNRRKVSKNHMCCLVTKSNELIIELWPKSGGAIEAPARKEFVSNDKKSRIYFYLRPFALKTKYPPFASFPMNLVQVDAFASIYEEGDSKPILPSNAKPIQSPEVVNDLLKTQIVGQVLHNMKELLQQGQGGSGGLNLGKNKLMIQIFIVVFGICVMLAGYGGFLLIQFVPYAQQWMALR